MEITAYKRDRIGFMEKITEKEHMKEPEKGAFLNALALFFNEKIPSHEDATILDWDSVVEENPQEFQPYPSLIVKLIVPYAGISEIIFKMEAVGGFHIAINRKYFTSFSEIEDMKAAIESIFDFAVQEISKEALSFKILKV